MSRDTMRQLLILGLLALAAMTFFLNKKGLATGWPVLPESLEGSADIAAMLQEGEGAQDSDVLWLEGGEEVPVSATERTEEQETQTARDLAAESSESRIRIVKKKQNPSVRVQLCGDYYEGAYHQKITLLCSTAYTVSYGNTREEHKASEPVWVTPEDPWLAEGTVTITPKEEGGVFTLPELKRAQENPVYAGEFVIEKRAEGLKVVNVLPLETYLRAVVPSEMPADYPMEALKAQAICARTYALKHLEQGRGTLEGADMDDSVSFQVYNNQPGNERTDQAVQETEGKVMTRDRALIDALYYSTSCGIDLSEDRSAEAVFGAFISAVGSADYEKDEPWYRWSAHFTLEELTRLTAGEEAVGAVTGLSVLSREKSGVIEKLEIRGEQGTRVIEGEYAIRKLLQTDHAEVTLQDGSKAPDIGMLPSAFFYLTPEYADGKLEGYLLTGGGYGHGKGMSQNGARHMADAGRKCGEILRYYFRGQ